MSLPPDDLARVAELIASGDKIGPEPERPVDRPSPVPPAPSSGIAGPPPVPPPPRKRARLYSPMRRGFMRSSREEGLADEVARMQAEASGTPFYDATEKAATTVGERLRRAAGKQEAKK